MLSGVTGALGAVPETAAAQPLDPSAVTASAPVRVGGSFVLVLLFGGTILHLRRGLVDHSVDSLLDRPAVSGPYGLVAYGLVGLLGVLAVNLVGQAGVSDTPATYIPAAILAGGVLGLGALGFAVVGTLLTGVYGRRRPWWGVLVGAVISAVPWVVLPLLPGTLAWILIPAFGIGGSTREWVHADRSTEVGS